MGNFRLVSDFSPTGDQPEAIASLVNGIKNGLHDQTLIGVTGSGKTFTMANVIAAAGRPAIILEPNKTLAAQVCSEMKALFPENAVEFFVSYYDYYQPEAYVPGKDIYIEKDAAINSEIDKLRHSATSALIERRDVIIVASVSCIYSLGDPEEYRQQVISLRRGATYPRDDIIRRLVAMQYARSDIGFERNNFRVRGDVLEIFPSNTDTDAVRVELFGDEIERISIINTVTGEAVADLTHAAIFPASHYVTGEEKRKKALDEIIAELDERIAFFESENKLIEAQRIRERTMFDVEQIREIGFCSGIENYSRVLSGRKPGSAPYTLLDFFPRDYILFADESHVMLPQIRGMSHGDSMRKKNLVDYGFRLPSAYDNRPLTFDEFNEKRGTVSRHHGICQRDTEGIRKGHFAEYSRADHPPDGAARSGGGGAPDKGADRRSCRRNTSAHRKARKSACHNAHKKDGGGSYRIFRAFGDPLPLYALRYRHYRTHGYSARASRRGI